MADVIKVTRKDVLNKVIGMTEEFTAEEIAVAQKMIASLEKRNGSTGVSEKVQAERQADKDAIKAVIEGAMTATEIANAVGLNVQKASARLKELVAEGAVVKTEAKGKKPATFALANEGDEDESAE